MWPRQATWFFAFVAHDHSINNTITKLTSVASQPMVLIGTELAPGCCPTHGPFLPHKAKGAHQIGELEEPVVVRS